MNYIKVIVWAVVVLVLIVLGPLATIWSLNTLFPILAIPYSIETWFAVIVLGSVFKSNIKVDK